jgi:hypothetical protein
MPKTARTALWLSGAVGMSSCGVHNAPRAFSPPPVTAKVQPIPPVPEIDGPEDVAFEPAVYDFPRQTDPSSRFPALPPPRATRAPVATVPKPPPAPSENPPAPALRLSQILTPEESRRNTQELDQYMESVKKQLLRVAGKNLNAEQQDIADRVRTYLTQAEQARDKDLVTAVNLARRADLLAKDLVERLP